MKFADKKIGFHIHTCHSFDSLLRPEKIIDYCVEKGYEMVIITDHNEIEGAKTAKEYASKHYPGRIEVVIGEEIFTDIGDIVAFPLTHKIEKGNYEFVFEKIKEQNAFICLVHPYSEHDLLRIHNDEIISKVDFVEVFNSRLINKKLNAYAEEYANKYGKMKIVGIDAHLKKELKNASFIWDEKYQIINDTRLLTKIRNIRLSSIIRDFRRKNYKRIPYLIILYLLGK